MEGKLSYPLKIKAIFTVESKDDTLITVFLKVENEELSIFQLQSYLVRQSIEKVFFNDFRNSNFYYR